jgi:hypothetical protein
VSRPSKAVTVPDERRRPSSTSAAASVLPVCLRSCMEAVGQRPDPDADISAGWSRPVARSTQQAVPGSLSVFALLSCGR